MSRLARHRQAVVFNRLAAAGGKTGGLGAAVMTVQSSWDPRMCFGARWGGVEITVCLTLGEVGSAFSAQGLAYDVTTPA